MLDVPYPSGQEEFTILHRMSVDPPRAEQVLTPEEVIKLQRVADSVFVHHSVMSYLVNLTVATRSPDRAFTARCVPQLCPSMVQR